MDDNFDSTDRRPGDYFLFALGFIGFMVTVAGVIVSSVPAAYCGLLVFLLSVLCFMGRPEPGEEGL